MLRRAYLAGIASLGIGSTINTGNWNRFTSGAVRFSGVTYNPVTAEYLADATAIISISEGLVFGTIQLGDDRYQIISDEVVQGQKGRKWRYSVSNSKSNGVFEKLKVASKGEGAISGQHLKKNPDGTKNQRSFILDKNSSHNAPSTSGIQSDIRNELANLQSDSPDSKRAAPSVSTQDDPEIPGGGGGPECSGEGTCTGYVGGTKDDQGWYVAGIHGYHRHPDYDAPWSQLDDEYGNRFHIQSFFTHRGDLCCDNERGGDWVDYRIERKDPEIEFENIFPTDEFTSEADSWSPSFSIGIGVPNTPLSVGIGSIRPLDKNGNVNYRSRQFVDWHVDLDHGFGGSPWIPNSQEKSEGVQVDIKPMNADGNMKKLKCESQYGYKKERTNGGCWTRSTQVIPWEFTVVVQNS